MKKCRAIVILIAIMLVLFISGCDWKNPFVSEKPKTKKELVAERFAKMTPPPAREPNVTATPIPAFTATPAPTPTLSPIPTSSPTPPPIDWSKEYDDYLKKDNLFPENYQLDTTVEIEGIKVDISLAQTENVDLLSALLGDTKINLFQADKKIYMQKIDKKGEEWYCAPISYDGQVKDVLGIDIFMDLENVESIVIGSVYGGEVSEDERIFDILNIMTSYSYGSMQVALYIDRDMQSICKMQTRYMEKDIIVYLQEREKIILPDKAQMAKSLTMDEFSKKVKRVVMLSVVSSMGTGTLK